MSIVRLGEDAAVVIETGLSTEPSNATWAVFDETDATLQAWANVPSGSWSSGAYKVTVPLALNTIPDGATRSMRIVRLRFRPSGASAGFVEAEASYAVVPDAELVIQKNSFQGYGEAMLLASEMSNLPGFEGASRELRVRALADAYRALVRLRFDIPEPENNQSRIVDFPGADPGALKEMSAAEFATLHPHFLDALRRAQVIEANDILNVQTGIEEKRRQGLVSDSVGETTQVYRKSKPLQSSICARAMQELRGYVVHSLRMRRGA